MSDQHSHVRVSYPPGRAYPLVELDGQDITNRLAAEHGLTIVWEGSGSPLPTVTLRLAAGTTVDLDLPEAIVKALPLEQPETTVRRLPCRTYSCDALYHEYDPTEHRLQDDGEDAGPYILHQRPASEDQLIRLGRFSRDAAAALNAVPEAEGGTA